MAWAGFAAAIWCRCTRLRGPATTCHGGAKVLGIFAGLADGFGGNAGGALREFINLTRTVVGCGRKGHRCVNGLGLLGEGVGASGEHVAQVVRRRHDKAGRGSGIPDK